MALVNGYCTLDDFKASKLIGSDNAIDDGFLEDLIAAASRYIDDMTARRFWSNTVDETRYYQAHNFGRLFVDDILSITTLKTDIDMDRVYETTWAVTDYDLMPSNAALWGEPYTYIQTVPINANGRYFPKQAKGVQIVGKFGYCSLANCPDAIRLATRMIVTTMYQNRFGTNVTGAATVTGAGVVITPQDIPSGAKALYTGFIKNWAV